MKNRILFVLFPVLVAFAFAAAGGLCAEGHLKVVTSNSIFADLAKEIGGDDVTVEAVSSPKFNPHFIQPKPSDVRKVKAADLFVFMGLDLEAWVDPLLEAAARPELFRGGQRNADLSEGIRLLNVPSRLDRSEGDIHAFGNPHYTMNPENFRTMAATLSRKLQEANPAHAELFRTNEKAFLGRLDAKIAEWKALTAHCAGKEVVSYHEDIAYFADFLGLKSEWFLEPKPGIPPTPKHLEDLEAHMKSEKVGVIVLPTYYSRATADEIARRAGAKVVLIGQQPGELPGTEDFFAFFDYNFRTIADALK